MFRSAERQRKRTRRRYLVLLAVAGFVAIGLTAVAVRKQVAEVLLAASIETESGSPVDVSVEEFSTTRFVATDLSLGPNGPRLARLEATYSLESILNGTVDLLVIAGLSATVRFDGERLTVPGFGAIPLGSESSSEGSEASLNAMIPFDQVEVRSALITFETPYGSGAVALDLAGELVGTQVNATGQLAASFQDSDVLTAQVSYGAQTASAEIQFSGLGVETQDGALWLRPDGALSLHQDAGQTVLSASSPIAVAWRSNSFADTASASPDAEAEPALPFQEGQLTLTSTDPDGTRLLDLISREDGIQADLWLRADVSGDAGAAAATIDASLAGQSLANLGASDIRTFRLDADALRLLDATWSGQTAISSLNLSDEIAAADVTLDVNWTEATDSVLRMAEGALRAQGLLRRTGEQIALDLSSGELLATDVLVADGLEILGGTNLRILEDATATLRVEQDQSVAWTGQFSLAPTQARLGGDTGITATLSVPNMTVSGAMSDNMRLEANWTGLALTSDYARLTQSSGSGSWSPAIWQMKTSAQVRRLLGESAQAAIRQLQINARSQDQSIQVSGQMGGSGVPDVLKLEGELDEGTDGLTGQVLLWASERAYAPTGLPASVLHDRLRPLSGLLAASATVDVTPAGATPSFKLILDDAAWQSESFQADGLFGVVDLDRLWPPASSVPQTLAVRSLDAGVPLENGAVNLTFNGAGRGQVTQAGFDFAGGRLEVEPFGFSVQPLEASATVTASGIEAGVVGAMFGVEGLSATGTLEGRLPLRIDDGGIQIESGFLRAADMGQLVYQPSVPPAALSQGSASLMLDALENFQYDRLVLSVDGPVNGDLTAAVALSGKNPNLYGGYPFELNVTVDGALGQIARQGVSTFTVPDRISQDIQEALIGIAP